MTGTTKINIIFEWKSNFCFTRTRKVQIIFECKSNFCFARTTKKNILFEWKLTFCLTGRDHGLPSYIEWREWCGLDERRVESWNELSNVIKDELVRWKSTNLIPQNPLKLRVFDGFFNFLDLIGFCENFMGDALFWDLISINKLKKILTGPAVLLISRLPMSLNSKIISSRSLTN